jgi:hypothetical protein
MRYNPETERGITLDDINAQCWAAVENARKNDGLLHFEEPTLVWDCSNGGWVAGSKPVALPVPF